jgi:hypothetical protein
MDKLNAGGSACGWIDSDEPATFVEADERPMSLSVAATKQMIAIQHAADSDPEAYMEACRAKGR